MGAGVMAENSARLAWLFGNAPAYPTGEGIEQLPIGMAEALYETPNDLATIYRNSVLSRTTPRMVGYDTAARLAEVARLRGGINNDMEQVRMYPPMADVLGLPQPQTQEGQIGRLAGNIGSPDPTDAIKAAKLFGMAADASPLLAGLGAFHGTPHRWPSTPDNPLGKVDLSKVGTGEGAQAYGWGFYAAENPKVAGEYANALEATVLKGEGGFTPKNIGENEVPFGVVKELHRRGSASPIEDAIEVYSKALEKAISRGDGMSADNIKRHLGVLGDWKNKGVKATSEKSIYELDIPDEAIDKMLDWDKPLSEQPKHVQNALMRIEEDYGFPVYTEAETGKDVVRTLENWIGAENLAGDRPGGAFQTASEILSEYGIPGNKYSDAMSRATEGGTRNFVVFDEDLVKVTGRK